MAVAEPVTPASAVRTRAFARTRRPLVLSRVWAWAAASLLVVVTLYNGLAAGVLAYAAIGLDRRGVLIWPAILCHAALFAWCLASARGVLARR